MPLNFGVLRTQNTICVQTPRLGFLNLLLTMLQPFPEFLMMSVLLEEAISTSDAVVDIISVFFSPAYFEFTIFRIGCIDSVDESRRRSFQDIDPYSCMDRSACSVNCTRMKGTPARRLTFWSCLGALLSDVCFHFTSVLSKFSQEWTQTIKRLKGKMCICRQTPLTDSWERLICK